MTVTMTVTGVRPPAPRLDVRVTDALDATTVAPQGDLDLATAPLLRDVLDDVVHAGRRVVIDLADVAFMDVAGLRLVVGYVRRSQAGEIDVTVDLGGARRVRRLVELLGLTSLFRARRRAGT